MASPSLTPAQEHALLNILTHHETFNEIEKFKFSGVIAGYGPPFDAETKKRSTSPILQSLLSRLVLGLPGLRDVSPDFWRIRCKNVIEQLGAAELSESYDKGVLTLRKTLATGISAILESVARAFYGKVPKKENKQPSSEYDMSDPKQLDKAWNTFVQQLVYGNMIDDLFDKAAQTDQLSEHTPLVQATHEYILVNVASLAYHTFVLSPDGMSLLRLMGNVHKLVPYGIIRQTLRVGNAATMINAMVKLLLAKLSVTSLTNWIGLSNSADEGMNLLQQVISTVLTWDSNVLRKRAQRIEQAKESPSKPHLSAIEAHVRLSRDDHEARRLKSKVQSKSIVTVIFEEADLPSDLSEAQHAQALIYLGVQLSLRDRAELSRIICRQHPDHISQAIRDLVAAYDPIIRSIHSAVDLSATLLDLENFLNDLLKVSKVEGGQNHSNGSGPSFPSVEDYVSLFKKHQGASHRFMHQVAKNCKDVAAWFRDYAQDVAHELRAPEDVHGPGGAGAMSASLNKLVSALQEDERKSILHTLDAHAKYLSALSRSSAARLRSIYAVSEKTSHAPGMYLAQWHALLSSTPITPASAHGPVRYGSSRDVLEAGQMDIDGEVKGPPKRVILDEEDGLPKPPDPDSIVRLLLPKFREALG